MNTSMKTRCAPRVDESVVHDIGCFAMYGAHERQQKQGGTLGNYRIKKSIMVVLR